jgi:hypothetical protein
MIEFSMHSVRTQNILKGHETADIGQIFSRLSEVLDKEKFYGTINMKFEAGKLTYVNVNQGFTVVDLAKTLNI